MKTLLSAKLFEDKIILIDSEAIEYPKTSLLEAIVKPYGADKLCFVTGAEVDKNFDLAARNISNLKVKSPQEFNLPDMLISDYIFVTRDGLSEREEVLAKRHANYYRNRKVSRPEVIEAWKAKKKDHFVRDIIEPIVHGQEPLPGDDLPLELQSETLRQYIDDLR
jgi:hypothetical protein